jgi:hypothetical protein
LRSRTQISWLGASTRRCRPVEVLPLEELEPQVDAALERLGVPDVRPQQGGTGEPARLHQTRDDQGRQRVDVDLDEVGQLDEDGPAEVTAVVVDGDPVTGLLELRQTQQQFVVDGDLIGDLDDDVVRLDGHRQHPGEEAPGQTDEDGSPVRDAVEAERGERGRDEARRGLFAARLAAVGTRRPAGALLPHGAEGQLVRDDPAGRVVDGLPAHPDVVHEPAPGRCGPAGRERTGPGRRCGGRGGVDRVGGHLVS